MFRKQRSGEDDAVVRRQLWCLLCINPCSVCIRKGHVVEEPCRSGITRLARCPTRSARDSGHEYKIKGDLQMKALLRFTTSITVALLMGVASFGQHYTETNLVSSAAGVASVTDPEFINTWGLARSSDSVWWISENVTGVVALYNGAGMKQSLAVTIPPADPTNKNTPKGSPTAGVFNGSKTDFLLAPGNPAVFLFATVDGAIAGWNPGVGLAPGATPPSTHAVTVVKTTDGSAYTGLTSALVGGKPYLYAANFAKGRVDVYDSEFHLVNPPQDQSESVSSNNDNPFSESSFVDENLPRSYVPFNVKTIGNDVVVTYALHEEGSPFETDGPGLGFVDIFGS